MKGSAVNFCNKCFLIFPTVKEGGLKMQLLSEYPLHYYFRTLYVALLVQYNAVGVFVNIIFKNRKSGKRKENS